jgi:choline dehydrogenase
MEGRSVTPGASAWVEGKEIAISQSCPDSNATSSARNFMIYQRGDKGSYQKWADAVGDDSYTFDNLMPYFKKSVKFTPPNTELRAPNATADYNTDAFSPTGGPLEVTYANYAGPFSSYMELGMNAIGIPTIQDFNSGTLLGTQYCASTIRAKEQKRDSSETSFLYQAQTRPNLQVYTLTRAHKIIFDENKQATGVDIGLGVVLSVTKEVILSAGTFQSPQILMLSGIGPKETLDQYNIPVIADRPGVGQNMQDHVMFGITYRYNVETLTRLANDLVYTAKKFAVDYTLFRRGVFTSPVADFIAWEKAPRNLLTSEAAAVLDEYPASWPEIEYFSTPGLVGDFSNVLQSQPNDGYQYASILGALVAPLSRGNVTINSNSIFDLPEINPNWLTDPTDVSVAIAAFKRLRQAFSTDAMRAGESDENEYAPGAKVQTDEQILDTIRSTLITVWHASCTCKMGKTDDPMAVVDTRARVIGVKGLRVVDASAMALLPAGHPQSTIYALAEKIADDIKNGR